jgi:hypothetical protein
MDLNLFGPACAIDVQCVPQAVVISAPLAIGLASEQTVTLVNRSAAPARFVWERPSVKIGMLTCLRWLIMEFPF